jgi:very-short-patch-repair endonuclease
MTQEGWRVIRFTGTEIFQAPRECASQVQEVYEVLSREQREILKLESKLARATMNDAE